MDGESGVLMDVIADRYSCCLARSTRWRSDRMFDGTRRAEDVGRGWRADLGDRDGLSDGR